MSIPRLHAVFNVGILAIGVLVVSACAVTDTDVAPTLETSSAATAPGPAATLAPASSPTPTATSIPTRTPIPTPSHRPGYDRGSALAIELGEVASAAFSFSSFPAHYYELQFKEGTTYTIDVRLGTMPSSRVLLVGADEGFLAFHKVGEGLPSSFVWTAKKSGPHFVLVDKDVRGSYTLIVTDPDTARAQTPTQTTTPDASPTSSPSAAALTFASVSAGGEHTCGITTSGAACRRSAIMGHF